MGQLRASNVSHGLTCVFEESSNQDNVAVAAEKRRQHILESMAKLEGLSTATPTTDLSPPLKSIDRKLHSTKSHFKANPFSQQFEPFPSRQSFTGFAPTPQAVPLFYYYPAYPPSLPPMHHHFAERNSIAFNPSLSTGSKHLKHLSVPTHNQGRGSQKVGSTPEESFSNARHTNSHHSGHSNNMRNVEKCYRSSSIVVPPETSPSSSVPTPPSILKYHSSNDQSTQMKNHPQLQFSEAHAQSQRYQGQHNVKPNFNQIQPLINQRSNYWKETSKKIEKKRQEGLILSNNYALQLESKKTGIKLIEKKRLTLDQIKVLETLPPLPPRPDPRRSSLLSPPKKEKKDPFAWFNY